MDDPSLSLRSVTSLRAGFKAAMVQEHGVVEECRASEKYHFPQPDPAMGVDSLGATSDLAERRRRAGRVTRLLGLLRAHGVIQKVPRTHRYIVTPKGRELVTAILSASQASVPHLLKIAA